jgi:hypothetical protein
MRYKPNLGNFDTSTLANPTKSAAGNADADEAKPKDKESDADEVEEYNFASSDEDQDEKKGTDAPSNVYKAIRTNPQVMINHNSKNMKQKQRDMKRVNRNKLIKELKNDINQVPEEVNYGIASGNKKVIEMNKEDETLEMEYFRRVDYSTKDRKARQRYALLPIYLNFV